MKWKQRNAVVAQVLLAASLHATMMAQERKTFEVASIRPMEPGASTRQSSRETPGYFEVASTSLASLLSRAFRVEPFQVAGPDWLATERFAVRATFPAGTSPSDVPDMLRSLLVERLHLEAHVERRRVPLYELVVGPSGPNFKEVPPADDIRMTLPKDQGLQVGIDRVSGLPGDEQRVILIADGGAMAMRTITRRSRYETKLLPDGSTQLEATRITMEEFIRKFAPTVGRPVVDKTGLTGAYQFKTVMPPVVPGVLPFTEDHNGNPIKPNPTGVSMFRSIEALGLKLEARDSPIDVVVVDGIDRKPTAD
jgi:uncharacterized protein (TIGR03435 family)